MQMMRHGRVEAHSSSTRSGVDDAHDAPIVLTD
jgi:hypothetical protein